MSDGIREFDVARLRIPWFASVAKISNIHQQRRRWLDPANTNPHWSCIEFVCSYPDSDQLADAHARRWLTARQFNILDALGQAIRSHSAPESDDYDNAAVLADPAWLNVVAYAQLAQRELLATVINESDRDMLSLET